MDCDCVKLEFEFRRHTCNRDEVRRLDSMKLTVVFRVPSDSGDGPSGWDGIP